MAKPIQPYGGPAYIIGPQGNKIGVRGGQVVPLPPTLMPVDPPLYSLPLPPRPVITHPKPPRPGVRPMPPIRTSPPIIQPARPPQRHTWHRRHSGHHPRQHPAPLGPPVYVPQVEKPPEPVYVAPPVATGPHCPTWGWMVSTNPDGSETVHACTPGQPAAAGLHGLESITDSIQGVLGPNWMLYLGLGAAAWFLLKKR